MRQRQQGGVRKVWRNTGSSSLALCAGAAAGVLTPTAGSVANRTCLRSAAGIRKPPFWAATWPALRSLGSAARKCPTTSVSAKGRASTIAGQNSPAGLGKLYPRRASKWTWRCSSSIVTSSRWTSAAKRATSSVLVLAGAGSGVSRAAISWGERDSNMVNLLMKQKTEKPHGSGKLFPVRADKLIRRNAEHAGDQDKDRDQEQEASFLETSAPILAARPSVAPAR